MSKDISRKPDLKKNVEDQKQLGGADLLAMIFGQYLTAKP